MKSKRCNGTGSVFKCGRGYRAVYTKYENGIRIVQRTKSGFRTKQEALNYLPQLQFSAIKNPQTLYYYYSLYKETAMQKISDSKQAAYERAWKRCSSIAPIKINELTIADLQKVADSQKTYYPAKDIKNLLSHLYKLAAAQQDVTNNLAQYIELPKLDESEAIPFNESEIALMWKHYDEGDTFVGYILLMIYSGIMPGELLKINKNMIDWQNQTIFGAGIKTKKRKKTPMVIADCAMTILFELCNKSETDKLVNMSKGVFYREYNKAIKRCGCRALPPYSCRHTTGTLSSGSIDSKKQLLRHANISTTQRYMHPDTAKALEVVNTIYKPVTDR